MHTTNLGLIMYTQGYFPLWFIHVAFLMSCSIHVEMLGVFQVLGDELKPFIFFKGL